MSVRRRGPLGEEPPIPESAFFDAAAARLIGELEDCRHPEVVVRCLARAYHRIEAITELAEEQLVMRAEAMARELLTTGLQSRRLAS